MRLFVLTAAISILAGGAFAAADPASLRAAGDWRLSEVGGRIACTLTFTRQTGVAGFEVKAPLACRRAFPALKSVAAWTLDDKGGIVLSDAHAQPIVTFPAQSRGPYETRSPDGRTWRLEPVKADTAVPPPPPTAPTLAPDKPAASP
jgi:hypothetical protein